MDDHVGQQRPKRMRDDGEDNALAGQWRLAPPVSPPYDPESTIQGFAAPVSPKYDPSLALPECFRIPDTAQLSGRRTDIQQPIELAFYSHDTTRAIHHNSRSSLPFFHPPTIPSSDPAATDLNIGFRDRFIQRDDRPEPLDAVLTALHNKKNDKQVDFCTWRGIMTKFMVTPYARRDSWTLRACMWKGTIYIDEPPVARKSFGGNERERLFTYYGYKFENLCTNNTRRPSREEVVQNREGEVNTNVQFCSITRTRIGGFGTVLAAEVDCADPNVEIGMDQSAYIELKTNRVLTNDKQRFQFQRHKLLKTWAQSFLIGVPKVVFGFRDDQGILREIKTFETRAIPREVRGIEGMWDPSVCLAFAAELLGRLRTFVKEEGKVYSLYYGPPFQEITAQQSEDGTAMLPEWFLRGEGPPESK